MSRQNPKEVRESTVIMFASSRRGTPGAGEVRLEPAARRGFQALTSPQGPTLWADRVGRDRGDRVFAHHRVDPPGPNSAPQRGHRDPGRTGRDVVRDEARLT